MVRASARRRLRSLLASVALVPAVLTVAACGATVTDSGATAQRGDLPAAIQQSGVLRNGADFTYPPLEYVEKDGKTFTGVDYELAEGIGEKLGVEVQHSNAAFGSLIPMLQSRRVDMVLSFATVTDERKEAVDFIEYSQSGTAMMVKKGNPEGIETIDDLCGKAVGLQSGAVQVPIAEAASERCVAAGKPAIDIKQLAKDSEVQLLLRAGRIAADLLDSPVAAYSAAQGDDFEVIPNERYEVRPHGVMVLKGNEQLATAIQKALQEMVADGSYTAILEKYDVADIALDEITISRAGD